MVVLLMLTIPFCTGSYIYQLKQKLSMPAEMPDYTALQLKTKQGHLYHHELNSKLSENGNLIWLYVCDDELRTEWNKSSQFSFDSTDVKGNKIRFTLVRFLTSKGLKKDADGVNALNDDEVKEIERGIPSANYKSRSGLENRLYETLWELNIYESTGDANGHTLTQRFEYWITGWKIFQDNFLCGVGTGDVQTAFDEQYIKDNTKLRPEWRLHSHNQFLSIAIAFGIVGLLWFLAMLLYPVIKTKSYKDFLYVSFFLVAVLSFLTEDTLETQDGVTFFAMLNSLFLFGKRKE